MESQIVFFRFSPHIQQNLIPEFVRCYREVFADAPWNEWKKCSVCGKTWGKNSESYLEEINFFHCQVKLEDFWLYEVVKENILKNINEKASCWVAMIGEEMIAFCFGYEITIEELEKRLGINFANKVVEYFGEGRVLAYQADMGVLKKYRGKKIAKDIFVARLKDLSEMGVEVCIIRAKKRPEPSVTYSWFRKEGYKILVEYPEEDGRVVLGLDMNTLKNIFLHRD